jgi:hypothetical protein
MAAAPGNEDHKLSLLRISRTQIWVSVWDLSRKGPEKQGISSNIGALTLATPNSQPENLSLRTVPLHINQSNPIPNMSFTTIPMPAIYILPLECRVHSASR